MGRLIADKYKEREAECNERFNTLKANEEELNRFFVDIYGLQDKLTPEVEDKDVTVRKADLTREITLLKIMQPLGLKLVVAQVNE